MRLEKNGDTLIVRPEGELDHHYAAKLRRAVDGAIMVGDVRKVVFDFTGVGFMDSSGIGVLIGRYRTLARRKGTLSVQNMNPLIERVFQLAGLHQIIKNHRCVAGGDRS